VLRTAAPADLLSFLRTTNGLRTERVDADDEALPALATDA